MKILGKIKTNEDSFDLAEISIMATPHELRVLAHFLLREADLMCEFKDSYGHSHLRDDWKLWKEEFCDVVVYKPSSEKS